MILQSIDSKSVLRSNEQDNNKHVISKISSKLLTFFLNSQQAVRHIKEYYSSLVANNLEKGVWPYENYYFSPQNPKIDMEAFRKGDLRMFKDIPLLEDMLNREDGINFSGNDAVRLKTHTLTKYLIKNDLLSGKNPILDTQSFQNFTSALERSKVENRKIVLLSNHQSHFDTFVLDYVFEELVQMMCAQNPSLDVKKIRFICGAYMYYSPSVRNFIVGVDTAFVFGEKDIKEITKFLLSHQRKDVIQSLKESAVDSIQRRPDSEMTILYPYAGRSEHKNGCKDAFLPGISPYLTQSNCIYLPVGFTGSQDILVNSYFLELLCTPGVKRVLKFLEKYKFNYLKSGNIHMTIGESFVGGQQSSDAVHAQMHSVANQSLERHK